MSHSQWNTPEVRGWGENPTNAMKVCDIWKTLDFKQVVSSGNARLHSNSFLNNTRAFYERPRRPLGVEDTGHVTIEYRLRNLLF